MNIFILSYSYVYRLYRDKLIHEAIITWQPLGPLLKVKLFVGYMQNPAKLKGAKGIRLT